MHFYPSRLPPLPTDHRYRTADELDRIAGIPVPSDPPAGDPPPEHDDDNPEDDPPTAPPGNMFNW